MSQFSSFGVTPLTANGMQFPITAQQTFGGPLTHYALSQQQTTNNFATQSNWGGGLTANPADDATALAAASIHQQQAKSINASGLTTQSLNLTHAASVVASHTVGAGVVVAAATQGSVTIVCAPYGPSAGISSSRDQSPSPSSLLFRQGQVSQMTVGLPDTPTCITLFPLPFSAPRSVGSAASIPDAVVFTNGNNSNNNNSTKQAFSSLGFNLCCAVGTSSGNIYIYDIVSRSGLPRDATVSAVPTCVSERSLRESADGSFAPATHKAGSVITDVCGTYTNGIQISILAIATSVSGVHFVRVSKSPNGEDIVLNNTVASVFQTSSNKVVSLRVLSSQDASASAKSSNNNNNNSVSGVALYRRSSILTFAVNYDNGSIKMVDLRLFITPSSGTEPQVTPEVNQILDARESSRYPSIVCGDIFVSSEQDVTSYSVEEGGSVVVNFIPSQQNCGNTNNNNGLADSQNLPTSSATPGPSNNNLNRESTGFSPAGGAVSALGVVQGTSTSNFHAASSSNTNPNGGASGSALGLSNNRIAVPRVNFLTCLTSSQAVASSRNSLLLLSASGNNLRARYNTQNLMTLPFVINDFSVLKVNNSSFVSDNSKVSRMVNGTAEVGNSSTIAFVAADRNLFLVHVPQ